jgi:nucleoside-diphosphate-sugar epimerase
VKILIVGGTGLISTGITRQLVARGDEVTIYTRGRRDIEIPAGVKRMVGDRDDSAAFESHMGQAGLFDVVIDMICFTPQHAESAIRAFAGRTAQYIFCSTVDVYTKPAKRYPVRENAEREPSPSFSYAFNKAVCERLFEEAHARGNFALTMIRPAWTYGEGGRILHTFGWDTYYLDRLRRGKPVIVHGDGTSFWVACHRDDVARGFVGAAGNEIAFGRAYHLTGKELLTWNAYTRTVAQALGAPTPRMVHIPTDLLGRVLPKSAEWCVENFSYNNIFDNTAARSDLGFACTIPFAEGARRVIGWLQAKGGFENSDDHPFYDQVVEAWERLGEGMAAQLSAFE